MTLLIAFVTAHGVAKPRAAAADETRAPAPVNTTIFVGGGMRFMGDPAAAVDKAAALGNERLSVCVTILVDLTDDLRVKSYGLFRPRSRDYQPFDDALRENLKETLRRTFARMVEHDMDIYILPHIDAGGRVHEWRNWVDFDPLVPYNGYTYEHLMLDTIAEALAETVADDTRVELALSGEMGASLFKYPESYLTMIERLRQRALAEPVAHRALAEPVAHGGLKSLKIGISLNHNQLAGESNPTFAEGETVELSDDQRTKMQKVIDASDFVGMSFYRPVSVEVPPSDFVAGINFFMGQFEKHGLTVPKSKPLHFSEVGIGGGYDQEEDPAGGPAAAVKTPWQGSGNPRRNPWDESEAMRDLRRRYHAALLEFLTEQPAPWQVSAAFFWSMGSWDPQGMQHDVFADPELVKAIRTHNQGVEPR